MLRIGIALVALAAPPAPAGSDTAFPYPRPVTSGPVAPPRLHHDGRSIPLVTRSGERPDPERGSTPASLGAAGDVRVMVPHSGRVSTLHRLGDPAGADDYVAVRFFPSQLGRENDFRIDGAWMTLDDWCSWSSNWSFSVVLEDAAMPLVPDLGAVVVPPRPFDASTRMPRGSGPDCGAPIQAFIDFPDTPYPASALLSVDDETHDDDFDRADSDLVSTGATNEPWFECSDVGCFTRLVKVRSNAATPNGRAGSYLDWRLDDGNLGDCEAGSGVLRCRRYKRDRVDDVLFERYNPDQDVRLTADFDLTSAQAARAGFFFRASLDFFEFYDYYSVIADAENARLELTHTWRDAGFNRITTTLASVPLSARAGTLEVEVTGYHPVEIRARVGATTLSFSHTDPDPGKVFHGDDNSGQIFGLAFPDAHGDERMDNFRVERNADLYLVAHLPPGESAAILGDGNEEARGFYAGFVSAGGQEWTQLRACTGATCADCQRASNPMLALQTVDPGTPGRSAVHQVDTPVLDLAIPCCGCSQTAYACASAANRIDGCAGPPDSFRRPLYEVGQPLRIVPTFTNAHAPSRPDPAAQRSYVVYAWLACDWSNGNCAQAPITLLGPCLQLAGPDCGAYLVELGDDWLSGQLPGLNLTTVTDLDGDGHPDGPLFVSPATPDTWTPTASGEYAVYVWELYDLDGDGDYPDAPNPEDHRASHLVQRRLCISDLPYNLDRSSLRMTRDDPSCAAGQIHATWAPRSLPLDPNTAFNVHEALGFRTGRPSIGNPYLTPALLGGILATEACIDPTRSPDVGYYAVFQADGCRGGSLADP